MRFRRWHAIRPVPIAHVTSGEAPPADPVADTLVGARACAGTSRHEWRDEAGRKHQATHLQRDSGQKVQGELQLRARNVPTVHTPSSPVAVC